MGARRIDDEELHAYVDGWLDGEARLAVERRMAEDPDTARQIEAYRSQNALLHELYDPILSETPPVLADLPALAAKLESRVAANDDRPVWHARSWVRAAAVVALMVAGGAGGWLGRDALVPVPAAGDVDQAAADTPASSSGPMRSFAAEAAAAHRFYTADDGAPRGEEMKADDPGALNSFLSERVGRPVVGPDLSASGYRLTGGRALPTELGPGAQYVYANGEGKRLTLMVGTAQQGKEGSSSFARQGDMAGFYWVDGGLAYALFGRQSREELMGLTKAIQANLKVRRPIAKPAEPASQTQIPDKHDNAPPIQPVADTRPKSS